MSDVDVDVDVEQLRVGAPAAAPPLGQLREAAIAAPLAELERLGREIDAVEARIDAIERRRGWA